MSWEPQKGQLWHEVMADMLILNPALNNEEIATAMGLHEQTVAAVRRGDMFKAMVERRRDRISGRVEDNYMQRLQGKLGNLAEVSVDTLTKQVEAEKLKMHGAVQQGTLETCEMALRSLGFIGAKGAAPAPQQHLTVVVNNEVLDGARQKMRTLHASAQRVSDGEALPDTHLLPAASQLP